MSKRFLLTLFVFGLSLFLLVPSAAPVWAQVETVASSGASGSASGANRGEVSGLPLPRFVSLRSDTVYLRAGPGMRYPVKWVYQRRNYPMQVVQEFDTWRKLRDADGEEGWVHQSLVSGNRYVLLRGDAPHTLYRRASSNSRKLAQIEPGVVAKLSECEDTWCKISASGYSGWLLKNPLWGVYEVEESN